MEPTEPIYEYMFFVWPSHDAGWNKDTFKLFDMLNQRIAMEFTEQAFEMFRSKVNHDGLTLREISRRAIVAEEIIL